MKSNHHSCSKDEVTGTEVVPPGCVSGERKTLEELTKQISGVFLCGRDTCHSRKQKRLGCVFGLPHLGVVRVEEGVGGPSTQELMTFELLCPSRHLLQD